MIEKFNQRREVPKEKSILNDINKQILLFEKIKDVYINRPELDSFKKKSNEGEYSDEAIEADKKYIIEKRALMDEKNSSYGKDNLEYLEGGFQLSEMLQAMVVDCLNKHWFKEYKAIMTSDFDDLKVGIDAIMKDKKGGYLGLAFDFTVSNQDKKIYEKLQKGWNKTTKGEIPTIKYFIDPDTKQQGKLLTPKFIIGASKKDVEEFANAYLTNDITTLENHPFKYLMLLQIEEQLQTVFEYFEANNNDKKLDFAKKKYENIQTILRNMKNEIHADEKMYQNKDTDLYEYTKSSTALDMMRRFRIMKDQTS